MADKQDKPSVANKQANQQAEDDPLLRIARMREEEQKEIMEDQRKLQDRWTKHLKTINTLSKRRR